MDKIINENKLKERMSDEELFRIKKFYTDVCTAPIVDLPYDKFMLFWTTGNRTEYQRFYFKRRGILNCSTILFLMYKDEKYKVTLENIIWAICNEYTWALPAHMPLDMRIEEQNSFLDLFSLETADALSEILSLVGEYLPTNLVNRVKYEIRQRAIVPYLDKSRIWGWDTTLNNWAAVCSGCVGMTFMYEATKEEFETVLPRIMKTLDCFLSGFTDDGCCMEGLSYWTYGFGYFTFFAEMLCRYTNGAINLFDNPKVRKIALYQQNMRLGKTKSVSFSDGHSAFSAMSGLASYLHSVYQEVTGVPKEFQIMFGDDNCYRWASFIRNLAWRDDSIQNASAPEFYYYTQAQWYIKNTDKLSFAAKGGSNNEPHNHNDIGSFIYICDDDVIFSDFGAGEYNAKYFSENRYDFLVNSSRGHSVPIINGEYQIPDVTERAEITKADKNEFSLNIKNAYNVKTLTSAQREFKFSDSDVVIHDSFDFSDSDGFVTERFFTLIKPEIENGFVKVGQKCLSADFSKYDVDIKSEDFSNHYANRVTAYMIDFTAKGKSKHIDCEFRIY